MNKTIRNILTTIAIAIATIGTTFAAQSKPRLVVNIIVGCMRGDDIERYGNNLTQDGFKRVMNGGAYYTDAYYDFSQCTTSATLATIATGANPSEHGVIGESWWSYTDGSYKSLITDIKSHPVPFSTGSGSYSAKQLFTPTMGDMLMESNPESKQFTIAIDPLSAIVLNGKHGTPIWAETNRTYWTTASSFAYSIPTWLDEYNRRDTNDKYILSRWTPIYKAEMYKNSEVAVMEGINNKHTQLLSDIDLNLGDSKYGHMCYTPAGNTMLLKLASAIIRNEGLGIDENTDILNICLDSSRYIAEIYGPESMEYEDMLYRLDKDINELLSELYGYAQDNSHIMVVITAAHGSSPSYNPVDKPEHDRFNTNQMEVLVNAYLSARYGSDSYILGYDNKAIYLNHKVIIDHDLTIDAIRDEVAVFLLQMRGIITARSSTALRNNAFTEGRARLIQHGFYAPRSGDVIIDFMPGWIIENSNYRSSSQMGYIYDRHVPLMIYGGGVEKKRVCERVDMCSVAPTICNIIDINTPWSSEGITLP